VSFLIVELALPQMSFIHLSSAQLCNRIQNLNCNKVKILENFFCNLLVCDVLCVITSIMAPHNDPGYD
jgi:hypothetical protein